MKEFYKAIADTIVDSMNNYFTDNHDEERFGVIAAKPKPVIKEKIKKIVFHERVSSVDLKSFLPQILANIGQYGTRLESLYIDLNDIESKQLLVDLVAFKVLGNYKVKLKNNTVSNKQTLERIKAIADQNDFINPDFIHFILYKFDLNSFGKDIRLYFTAAGIFVDFFLEQYKYKNHSFEISAQPGDVVIDAGGGWGDTALYFADRVGQKGKVYSFEFIPKNLSIFKRNCNLNPGLKDNIEVIDKPVWNTSGKKVYFKDFGPGSKVEFDEFEKTDGTTETISIDDLVETNKLQKVDFIKMDIEGAELYALEGAKKTIEKFRPKLAIAIYHSNDDFVNIPKWILDLNVGYKIYLGHYTIHAEETIIFATTK